MAARRGRNPAGRYKISLGKNGKWQAYPRVGTLPNGRPKRVHIERDTAEQVAEAMHELFERVKAAGGTAPKKIETVSEWLDHYLEHIVRPVKPQSTWKAYRSLVETWAKPHIGARRLAGTRNQLEPEHLDGMYNAMRKGGGRKGKGMAESSLVKMHAILSKAFDVAVRRGRALRNVCDLIEAPTARKRKPDGYSVKDAQALLTAAASDRLEARWYLGILLGPRQGEALGIRWPHLDLTAVDEHGEPRPRINLQKQTQRGTWQHGCQDPRACAARKCRTRPCGPSWAHGCPDPGECKRNPRWCPERLQTSCRRHRRACPPPCRLGCTRHAMHCPERVDGGLLEVDLKSEGSVRTLFPPPQVVDALERWRQTQMREAQARGMRWDDQGHVFTTKDGKQLDPRRDYDEWRALARRAGVPMKRLHAARHTAATLLVATGTDISVVQDNMGHADIRTARGYVGPAEDLQREATARLANALFAGELGAMLAAAQAGRTTPGA
ncbi:tyrosine-type recombinase/integrase, partial [Dactylosporangium sp. NPDC005572]|uniref:tyrosine-type recombinase/integrase n=1 Tax=Dactylosporangium sp. NPDC005572 TaxID=3156889 RepID=UPI0033A34444